MANRSCLYAVDEVPGQPRTTPARPLSEWSGEVPILHRVLLTGSPRLCPSTIWDPPVQAIIGDYDSGVAHLERYVAALPQTDEVRANAAAALAVLRDPSRRGRYLLLETAEIVTLRLDDPSEGEDREAATAGAFRMELAEVGDIDGWLRQAGTIRPEDLAGATGAGHWPEVVDHQPPPTLPPAPTTPPTPYQPSPGAYVVPPVAYGVAPTGAAAWGFGFLALIPVPVLGSIMTGLVMLLVGRSQRQHGPPVATVGRNAANWGLTYVVVSLLLWVGHFVLLYRFTKDGPSSDFYPVGIPMTIWAAFTLVHLIICGVGVSRAKRGAVFAPPSIPFLGHRRSS
jgi:hypothetical protein